MKDYKLLIIIIYVAILLFMSLVAIVLYAKDKSMAKNNGGANRIKEKTLLGVSVFGGALGAFIGRILFHHKTDKLYFSLTIYFSLLLEAATLAFLLWAKFGGVL